MGKNEGLVTSNETGAAVTTNTGDGVITENKGAVTTNTSGGTIILNSGAVTTNNAGGIITQNNGTLTNANAGIITTNNANLDTNGEYGTIGTNNAHLETNAGTVEENSVDGEIKINQGTVEENAGMVRINQGTIEENIGTVVANSGTVGAVDEGGSLRGNSGTVTCNNANGAVLNLDNGIVETNYGDVYNCGGTVGSNLNQGTEYFPVAIVNDTQNTTVTTSGMKQVFDQTWLGQTAGVQSAGTIVFAPREGYEIKTIQGLSDNVSAVRLDDGSWRLTVTSGVSTTIHVPEATEIPIPKHRVTLIAVDDDGATVTGGGEYAEGAVVTLNAQPSAGHYFIGWYNTYNVTITDDQFVMPTRDVTIIARFGPLYAVTSTVFPEGCGAVTASQEAVPKGTQVSLIATPISGYHFKEWRVTPDTVTITNDTFTMPEGGATVTAVFVGETPYQITLYDTVATLLDGWTGSGVTQAVHGDELMLQLSETAAPQAGNYFTGEFTVNGKSLGVQYDEYLLYSWPVTEFTMPAEDVTIAAEQAPQESVALALTPGASLIMPYMALVQLRNDEDTMALFTTDENGNEFIDLDGSGTPDISVTDPDGKTTADYTLTLLEVADATEGKYLFSFSGSTDRYGTVSITLLTELTVSAPDFILPADLTEIEEEAFEGIGAIVVAVLASCASIGDRAFKDCPALVQIHIPAACTLGEDVFAGCARVYVFSAAGSPAEAYCNDPAHGNCLFVPE